MKTLKSIRAIIVLLGLVLGACAPAALPSAAPANVGAGKAISDVVFTGVIESMQGNQWVIDGQTITVDSSVLQDGPFVVGDTVKVEASIADDGTVTAQRVETPSAADLVDASPAPTEAAPTSAPGDVAVQSLVFDDGGNEAFGTLESLTDTSITVGGQTFSLAPGVEINGQLEPGDLVKLHLITNPDGTLSVTEIQIADPSQLNDNSNDDNSNEINGNDNTNDDNGNDNSNDDNGNSNSNDDHSNDDNGNDDHSGNDSGSGGGNDDNGGSGDNSGGNGNGDD